MNTPEDHLMDALAIVTSWDLLDEDIAEAANQQAHLMAGCSLDYYESNQAEYLSMPHR